MSNDQGQDERVWTIVEAAIRLHAEERASYIRAQCGGEGALYDEVMEIVDREDRMGLFLKEPMLHLGAFSRPFQAGNLVAERFEIVREIGEGGMGIVYEALDRRRNQRIAIKAAKSGRQLWPELESALRVRHTNICLVNDVHRATTQNGEVDFLTMELLEGDTLAARLSGEGKLPAAEAAEIARQLCAGLAEAHRSGVIHRDLKPANIILCRLPNGGLRAVIMDFGLSSDAAQDEGLVGTPRYMAPELWLGAQSSKASDYYALGVILYEMVEGRVPAGDAAAQRQKPSSNDPYWRLTQDCLSLDLDTRNRAFQRVSQYGYWQPNGWSRRKMFAAAATGACALLGGAWLERGEIDNLLQPLPKKRFVALIAWPPTAEAGAIPMVSGVMDALENQLTRAEAVDHDFLVLPARNAPKGTESQQVCKICQSLGTNLALAITGAAVANKIHLLLRVMDAKTAQVLRERKLSSSLGEIPLLAVNAVAAAAALLNLHPAAEQAPPLKPGTESTVAFEAFQVAEELKKRPNDDGLEEAIVNYRKAVEADNKYALAYARLAAAYLRLYIVKPDSGALPLADSNANRAIQLEPNLADGHSALAKVFATKGQEKDAVDEMQRALALDPSNGRNLIWQGQIYTDSNRWNEARDVYTRLKTIRPNYWVVYNDYGAMLVQQGQYSQAAPEFRAAKTLAPLQTLPLDNLGAVLVRLGRLAEAKANCEASLKLKPNSSAFASLSEALRDEGKYTEATDNAKRAVELEPSEDRYWLNLAECLTRVPAMKTEVLAAYRRAATEAAHLLETNPTDGAAWIRLALYRVKSGSRDQASALLPKFEQFPVTDLDSKLMKARLLELLGARKQALILLAECAAEGTTNFEMESLSDLAQLRHDPGYARLVRERLGSTNN